MSHYMLGGAKRRYRTVAAMVVVLVPDGDTYVKGTGTMLPRDADQADVERLLELGLIEEVEVA